MAYFKMIMASIITILAICRAAASTEHGIRAGLTSGRGVSIPCGKISSGSGDINLIPLSPSYLYGMKILIPAGDYWEISSGASYSSSPISITRSRSGAESSTVIDASFGEFSIGWNFCMKNFFIGTEVFYLADIPGWRTANSSDGNTTWILLHGKYSGRARSSIAVGASAGYSFTITPSISLNCGVNFLYSLSPVYVNGDDRLNLSRIMIQTGLFSRI